MRSTLVWAFASLVIVCAGLADEQLRFEVASVRPSKGSGSRRMSGGPGTQDPARFVCENCKLTNLLVAAYGVPMYQLDAPHVLDSRRVDVMAKVPLGHSRDDFRLMLQRLLAERFECQTHWETRPLPVYYLEEARGGRRFNETAAVAAETNNTTSTAQAEKLKLGADGYPDLKGTSVRCAMIGNRLRLQLPNATLADLAIRLELQLPIPLIDRTGLNGRYDFILSWIAQDGSADHVSIAKSPADGLDEVGPDLFAALQQQLGLRLEKSKADLRVLVVDHMREVPTEN